MFYLIKEDDIWWSIVKDRLAGPKFAWSKFLKEQRAKFYPITIQLQKEKEFTKLRIVEIIIVMHSASRLIDYPNLSLSL